MATSYPDYVARFYDVVYAHLRTQDHDFYLKKIKESKGPVLEIGVGTGRFFLEALSSGADVYGIDSNKTMLMILKDHLEPADHYRISLQDAEAFSLDRKFDLIISPFRVFSHLVTIEQQLNVLERVHYHLKDSGRFIFDLFVPDMKLEIRNNIDFDGEYEPGKKLRRTTSVVRNPIEQVNNVTMQYEWDEGGKWNSESWTFPMRYYFRWELEHLIARSPLTLESIYGDYLENPLTNNSKDFVVMCKRT